MSTHNKGDTARTTATISHDLLARLDERGQRGETYEQIIRRLVELPELAEVEDEDG